MAHRVQRRLMALKIKYRPTKPRSPHLNGKVERSLQNGFRRVLRLS